MVFRPDREGALGAAFLADGFLTDGFLTDGFLTDGFLAAGFRFVGFLDVGLRAACPAVALWAPRVVLAAFRLVGLTGSAGPSVAEMV